MINDPFKGVMESKKKSDTEPLESIQKENDYFSAHKTKSISQTALVIA